MIIKFFILFFLILSSDAALKNSKNIEKNGKENLNRTKRAISGIQGFFTFLGTFKNVVVDQYTDTKTTLNKFYDIIQDTFSDTVRRTTTPKYLEARDDNSTTMTTTTEKYRISRYEAGRILGRNYRGLQKLLRLELNDALNQSNYNIIDYQREIQNAIGPKNLTATKILIKRKRKLYSRRAQN